MFFLFFIRSFIALALVPALVAWVLSARTKWPAIVCFGAVYLLLGLMVFNASLITDKIKPLEIITSKQAEYLELAGAATKIELISLQPTFKSFAMNAPAALNHSLLRPYLWEIPVMSLLPLAIELFLYQLLFLGFVFLKRKGYYNTNKSFLLFAIFFTLTVFLLIGYIAPNLGSLVRYRSLYLPLIITPILCSLDCGRFKRII